MHIKTTLDNHPQLKQLLGAVGGASVALAVYYTYQFGAGIVSAHVIADEEAVSPEAEIVDVDERATFERIGAVAREKLRGMEAEESVD